MSNGYKIIFVEATVMNIAAKFQLCPHYSFRGDDSLIFFHNISLSVVMTAYQIEVFGLK